MYHVETEQMLMPCDHACDQSWRAMPAMTSSDEAHSHHTHSSQLVMSFGGI
jgi:hypothetical protein